MKLADILARRAAVEAEMRTLYDAAEKAGADLAGDQLAAWNRLSAERADLAAKEERARARDDLDRAAKGTPLEQRGAPDDRGAALGLKPEQRMADVVKTSTGIDPAGLSVGRAVVGMVTGRWQDAEAERRTMGTSPGSAGGFMMPAPIAANLIDLARNATVLIQAGALTIPMVSKDLRAVRVLADPDAEWRAEGAAIDESDAAFAALNYTAHSLAALVRVNAELLDDVPSFAATLDGMLASALALKLDAAGLYGTGVAQPLGLRNTSGIQEESMGTDGAVPADYDDLLDLITKVETANGNVATLIWAPRTKGTMAKLVTGISGDKTKLTAPPDVAALRKLTSNQVSTAETQGATNAASTVFAGGFASCSFAIRQDITIEASRVAGDAFAKNQVLVRAILRADFAATRPALLGRLIGIKAA